ncbi:MAG TPA: MFS transporter [Actinomycetota bacterium]|nr:MFS transporter [Actinomycetota bacterium]
MRILRPLANREFRLLWGGQAVSQLGDGIFTVALAWQTLQLSKSPATLSLVLFARTLPLILFALVGGAVSDRLPRRTVMVASDAVRGAAVGTIAFLAATGDLRVTHLVLLGAVFGSAEAFFLPSISAIYPEVAPTELLLQANALRSTSTTLAEQLIGPAVGGILIAAVGTTLAFTANAVSFGVSLASLVVIRVAADERPERTNLLHQVREGLAFTRKQTWLWASMVVTAASNFFLAGPLRVAIPVLVKDELHAGSAALGAVYASLGAGGLTAVVLAGQIGITRRRAATMYIGWASAGIFAAVAGLAPRLIVVSAMAAGVGFGIGLGNVIWFTLVQELIPKRVLGRVFSVDMVVSTGLYPMSIAVSGPLAGSIGGPTTLVVGGVAAAVATALAFTVPGALDPDRSEAAAERG